MVHNLGDGHTYERLTEYKRLPPGNPKIVVDRNHLHALGLPRDALTPVVIQEVSTISNYSHEPTTFEKSYLLEAGRTAAYRFLFHSFSRPRDELSANAGSDRHS